MTDQTAARSQRAIVVLLGFLSAVVVCLVLKELGTIFKPLVLAFFLAVVATPVVEWLTTRKVPQWAAITLVVISIFMVIFLVGVLIYETGTLLAERLPAYAERLRVMAVDLVLMVGLPPSVALNFFDSLHWSSIVDPGQAASFFGSALGTFAGMLTNLLVVLVFFVYILSAWPGISSRIRRAFPDERGERIVSVFTATDDQVRRYLAAKIALGLATAVIVYVILTAFGVDFAVFWAFLGFMLGFIPNIGSVIALVPPLLLAFIQFGFGARLVVMALFLIVSQNVMGNVIEPKLMGQRLNLSPLVVIVALIFWSAIWGVVGVVLAVPITAILRLAFDQVDSLKPVASLMGSGRIGKAKR